MVMCSINPVEIKPSDKTFSQLISDSPSGISKEICGSNVVILPSHDTNDSFYSGTLDVLDFLNNGNLNVGLYSSDDDYQELSLHGDEHWVGTFIIKNVVIPIFCSLIASYIFDELGAKNQDQVSMKVYAEKKDGTVLFVNFQGNSESLTDALEKIKEIQNAD